MGEIGEWARKIDATIASIMSGFEERYGYPPGENYLDQAVDYEAVSRLSRLEGVPAELMEFYTHVRELSATDVGVGYRIHPPGLVEQWVAELREASGRIQGSIVVFGTDGGGNYLAISGTGSGLVYYLPHEASVESGRYKSDDPEFRVVAGNFDEFLDALLAGFCSFLQSGTARIF